MFLIRNTAAGQSRRLAQTNYSLRCRCMSNGPKRPGDDPENQQKWDIPEQHPVKRTIKILGDDLKRAGHKVMNTIDALRQVNRAINGPKIQPRKIAINAVDNFIENREKDTIFQTHCDVLVIGGGGIGSSVAYWLKKRAHHGLNVVVLEKDPTYKEASTPLSVGGLRQQFSLPENIQMSLYGAEFLRNIKEHLGEDVDVNFTPFGYLMMATEKSADIIRQNSKLQNELGAKNEILSAKRLKEKFPWLNTDGIELGCHGLEKEGWFDPWALLCALKRKSLEMGAHYVQAEIIGFEYQKQPDIFVQGIESGQYEQARVAIVKMPDGEIHKITFAICVIAAGAQSGNVAKLARIGAGPGMLSIPLPIEPRKRFVYVFSCEENSTVGPGINTPLVIDPSNVYFRREGLSGLYIGGRSPESIDKEPSCDNLDVDFNYFDTDVWPHLAHRVPKFEALKVRNAWAGFYEYNTFDENGIIGPHPYHQNIFIASGFSGHGE